MTLSENFEALANLYVEAFLRKHGLFDDENGDYYDWSWVAGDVGGIVEVADYFIVVDDIRYDIDNFVQKDLFFQWYNFRLKNEESKINYKSFAKGLRE